MHPNLPNSQSEENQIQPSASHAAIEPETSPVQGGGKISRRNIISIVLGILVFILLVVSSGLGIFAYVLTSRLTSTQQQFSALQTEYEQLKAEYTSLVSDNEKLTADFSQAKIDLEKSNADLSAVQDDLKKSQEQNKKLTDKIAKAGRLANILYAWSNIKGPGDFFKIDSLIKSTNDTQLIELWDALVDSPTEQNFDEFFTYLLKAVRDSLE